MQIVIARGQMSYTGGDLFKRESARLHLSADFGCSRDGGYCIRSGIIVFTLDSVCHHQPNLYHLASTRLFWFIDHLN